MGSLGYRTACFYEIRSMQGQKENLESLTSLGLLCYSTAQQENMTLLRIWGMLLTRCRMTARAPLLLPMSNIHRALISYCCDNNKMMVSTTTVACMVVLHLLKFWFCGVKGVGPTPPA